jgi:ATP-dependent RNA helicase DDX54/DBP10
LRNVVGTDKQTVVFVATKHHVEFLSEYLALEGIPCTHSYGALDATARKINVAKFRAQKVKK